MTFRPIIGILALVFLMHSATASSQTLGEIEENVVALGCNWQPFTPDQTAFAAQPGGVFPLNDVVAGSYRILVGPAGKDGHDLPPATWNAFGPYNLRGGHKYKALIEGPGGKFLRFEEDSADLLLYSSPPAGFARVYARNNCVGDTWYAICLKPIEPAEGADPVAKTSAPATGKLLEEPTRVADTTNIAAVHNGPTVPTTFSINSPYLVTEIHDYHWNNAQGATPGTIGLQDQNGKCTAPGRQ